MAAFFSSSLCSFKSHSIIMLTGCIPSDAHRCNNLCARVCACACVCQTSQAECLKCLSPEAIHKGLLQPFSTHTHHFPLPAAQEDHSTRSCMCMRQRGVCCVSMMDGHLKKRTKKSKFVDKDVYTDIMLHHLHATSIVPLTGFQPHS